MDNSRKSNNDLKVEKKSDELPQKTKERKKSEKENFCNTSLLTNKTNKGEKNSETESEKKIDLKRQCDLIEKSLNECFNTVHEIYDKYFAKAKGVQPKENVFVGFNDYIISLLNHNLNLKSLSSDARKEYLALFGDGMLDAQKSNAQYVNNLQKENFNLPFALKMTIATDVHFKKDETQKILNEVYKIYSITCGLCNYRRTKLKKELFETVINFANGQGLKIE